LFDLAQKPPEPWKFLRIKVLRRDREQTASGAVQSALYGAAFKISSSSVRQAKNHYIQSPGAEITKDVQRKVWDIQPEGIGIWIVRPMSVHDEINAVVRRDYEQTVKDRVDQTVESYRPKVPLIEMQWKVGMNNWSEK
jgi:hypothetical protein